MIKDELKYWIWYLRINNVTSVKKMRLLEQYKELKNIFNLTLKELQQCKDLNEKDINEILKNEYRCNLEKYEKYINDNNIKIITVFDEIYPDKLRNIYDKPIALFCKGNINLLNEDTIAIVGARQCSNYGKNVSQKLSYDLSKEGKCIISGLAKGVDTNAHIGALNAIGKTIAVIGNGLDYIYPYENKKLYEQILENNGLIITEYIIGIKPEKINFPARNRIISALADGIVVVEAKRRSGSLITVDFGLEYGKEIFAVPGNINNINSEGTNELIKQGANILTNYKDIINICYN